MKRKIIYILFLLSFILITSYYIKIQFQTEELYSYDAYSQIGFSNLISIKEKISNDITEPYSIKDIKNPTGYFQIIPIIHNIFKNITGLDSFLSLKLLSLFLFCLFLLIIFIVTMKIFNNTIITIFSVLIYSFIPIIFYRYSFFVPENFGIIFNLTILFFILSYQILPLIILFPIALATHPKSIILFGSIYIIYILINRKKFLIKNNLIYLFFIIVLSLLFSKPLFEIFFSYISSKGAIYPLYPPLEDRFLSLLLIKNLIGIQSILFILLGFMYINFYKNNRYILIMMWILLTILMLYISQFLNFPINRVILYLALILPFSFGFTYLNLKKSLDKRILILFISLVLIISILSFYSSPNRMPFLGWGSEERIGMNFLKETIIKHNSDSYGIITSEYGLPFGYNLKNIEFNESKISYLFNLSSIDEFKLNLESQYPDKEYFYIVLGVYSCDYMKHYNIIKSLCDSDGIYKNNRLRIILFKNENINIGS